VLRGYPLAHLAQVRSVISDDLDSNRELSDALKTALSNRRSLTAAEKENELSFRQQFLPEIFLDEFVKMVEG
jgi:hypothetical protein